MKAPTLRTLPRALGLALATLLTLAGAQAQAAADPALVAARQKIFGVENVDAATGALPHDRVLFSWLTNSTFAASFAGRVVFLDTFVTRLETDDKGRTPFVIQDLVDLQPEAILLGHGHYDHADNAAYIAARTGAAIYATAENCGVMQSDFARQKADPAIQGNPSTRFAPNAQVVCHQVTTAGSAPATQVVRIPVLEPTACVIAFRHMHSVEVPADRDFPPTPVKILIDPRDAVLFPPRTSLTPAKGAAAQPGQMDLSTHGDRGPGDAAPLFFDFVMRGGSNLTIAWHNSAGALKEGKGQGWNGNAEDGKRIDALLRRLPYTDVQMGTASTANFTNNGLRDLIQYQDALKPRIFVPNHLTTGSQTREASSLAVFAGYRNQLELMGRPRSEWPQMRWLIDPVDYGVPFGFSTTASAWARPGKKARIDSFCQ
ncbi:MAG: hypothetical protein V4505_13080 [Pseudomonadota bacterium]